MRAFVWASLIASGWWAGAGCGPDATAELGFVLVRPEPVVLATGLRATGLDRDHVSSAVCQVLAADGSLVVGDEAVLDPQTPVGEQTLRLQQVPIGAGYFARIRGLAQDGSVWECGASGPFELERGAKRFVTIVIDRPPAEDPDCSLLCSAHAACEPSQYCASPCVRDPLSVECTNALCRHDWLGERCNLQECGPGFACLTDSAGWPGGYCSASCAQDQTCPGKGLCWQEERRCVRLCVHSNDCREADGYACADVGDGRTGCLPQ